MTRIKLGSCGVDSGQLMIVDPCYLSDWKGNDYNIEEEYTLEATEDITLKKTMNGYEKEIKIKKGETIKVISTKGDWFTLVDAINDKRLKTIKTRYVGLKKDLSYNGACSVTLSGHGGELEEGMAVATSTGYGDGCYDVWATIEDNRVKKIEVKFF